MTEQIFARAANILAIMPSNIEWDERSNALYAFFMSDWNDDLVMATMKKALYDCKFRPTTSELAEIAFSIIKPHSNKDLMWDTITDITVKHIENGRNHALQNRINDGKADPMTPMLVEAMGGWGHIGRRSTDDNKERLNRAYNQVLQSIDRESLFKAPINRLQSGTSETKQIDH